MINDELKDSCGVLNRKKYTYETINFQYIHFLRSLSAFDGMRLGVWCQQRPRPITQARVVSAACLRPREVLSIFVKSLLHGALVSAKF